MIARARLAWRLQRFEVVAAIVAVAIVAISAVVVRIRLDGVGVPASCWEVWFSSAPDANTSSCSGIVGSFLDINEYEGGKIMAAMAVLPFALGLFLGVPLVGREIEGRTAPTVWALARSRVRWLLGRLVPMLILLVVLLVVLAIASEVLWMGRNPWQPIPNFNDAGLHGIALIGKGLAAFGVSLLVGAMFGRLLPAIVLGAVVCLGLVVVSGTLMSGWLLVEAIKHQLPGTKAGGSDESMYPGGTYFSTAWVGPDGEILFGEEEAMALAPEGTQDPVAWIYEHVPTVMMGVPGSQYPDYERIEALLFSTIALGTLLVTFPVVKRRRPM